MRNNEAYLEKQVEHLKKEIKRRDEALQRADDYAADLRAKLRSLDKAIDKLITQQVEGSYVLQNGEAAVSEQEGSETRVADVLEEGQGGE